MAIKQDRHIVKGMQKDLDVSKFNAEFVLDAKNIRITAKNNETLLAVTNEKGNKEIPISASITGTFLGYNVLNNYITLFTTGDKYTLRDSSEVYSNLSTDNSNNQVDYIYLISLIDDAFSVSILYKGYLKFSPKHPIETIGFFENNNIQKVYWIDGLNQPRYINIVAKNSIKEKWNDDSFDFVSTLKLNEDVSITKNTVSNGMFAPGIIQYAFTYYNKYGQESNIFYISPLFYISFSDRGAGPDEVVGNSFNISLKNLDTNFNYIKIYSIHRTSLDATPTITLVTSLSSDGTDITYIDKGTEGSIVEATKLLYVGGTRIVPQTMTSKDNTLFLGNIVLSDEVVKDSIINTVRSLQINYESDKPMALPETQEYYSYKNQLDKSDNNIKTFKYLEYYRFGIQLQYKTGKWSEPIYITDLQNKVAIKSNVDNTDLLVTASSILSKEFINTLYDLGYISIRPLIVYPTLSDRECICQGILCPTVYNWKDRTDNSPYVQSSWFARPNAPCEYPNTLNDLPLQGSSLEFRHEQPIPINTETNAEIQCITSKSNDVNFSVDQSILTLHSPEIEFDSSIQNMDKSNLKLRIVGMVPLTSFISDIDIQTSNTGASSGSIEYADSTRNSYYGFNKKTVSAKYLSTNGWKALSSCSFWVDEYNDTYNDDLQDPKKFVVYPWHRNGSLNDSSNHTDKERTAILSQKKLSNLRFSYDTFYIQDANSIWNAEIEDDNTHTGISGAEEFNSNEVSLIKLKAPKNSDLEDLNYYGNIDKILVPDLISESSEHEIEEGADSIVGGYPIVINTGGTTFSKYQEVSKDDSKSWLGDDSVEMKYKSTPHVVVVLNYTKEKYQNILPAIKVNGTILNDSSSTSSTTGSIYDRDNNVTLINRNQDTLDSSIFGDEMADIKYGFLYLAELYNDNVINRFGGTTENDFINNTWLPCGDKLYIKDCRDKSDPIKLKWTGGDTYYQRYDNLKTYPFTQSDQNSVIDIVSFKCETRINLDGRYDKNRGQTNNLNMTPDNFNKLNTIYSQKDNYFNYRGINHEDFSLDYFPNSITWTKEKQAGNLIDNWTNITLASTLDLDGDKGDITSLNTFNNEIYCFQQHAFSNILFNSRVQIATSDSTPIEISNGLKVSGKRYINNSIGCNNKWSIIESVRGVYFINDINSTLYLFDGKLNPLSTTLGMKHWFSTQCNLSTWNPKTFSNFKGFYDRNNNDIYYINKDYCLYYSELIGQFISFLSYEGIPALFNVKDKLVSYKDGNLWLQNEGDYNIFFCKEEDKDAWSEYYKPFNITFISNPDEPYDKTFNTVEFRSDSLDINGNLLPSTFDNLETWNEYQRGKIELKNVYAYPSSLKKKYRIWRANIPRDNSNKMDRMRNTWLKLKLSKDSPNKDLTVLHDFVVNYFI